MNRKIWAVLLVAVMLMGLSAVCTFAEQDGAESGYSMEQQISILKSLNVMQGDPDGNLRLDDPVTRAEFTKMAIAISSLRNSVASQLSVSPFKDVPYSHWAAPYIRVAVSGGYVKGYTDSTFKPDSSVSYAEATTIALKLLGYTDSDFGGAWPYGQMGSAKSLGLTDNIVGDYNAPLSRGGCVILLNNLLDTKIKGSAVKYATVMDCEIRESVILVATKKEDPSVADGKVYTTAGTFKLPDGFDHSNIGLRGDIVIQSGDRIISFIPTGNGYVEKMAVYSNINNVIIGYVDGVLTQETIPANTTTYMGTGMTAFSGALTTLGMGSVITMYKDAQGDIEYVSINEGSALKGPYIVSEGAWYSEFCSSLDNTVVVRDGVKSSVAQLMKNDVAYYSADLDMMFVYINKKTGIYESAYPNKDVPARVTVSGVTYELEGAVAFNALSSAGTLEYGDTITILLGKDGKAAGAVSATTTSETVYGYVTATGKKVFTDSTGDEYTSNYVTIATPDGNTVDYVTSSDCSKFKCHIVKVELGENETKVSKMNIKTGVSGIVNAKSRTIGGIKLADDVDILDIYGTGTAALPIYTKVFLNRIDGIKLSEEDVVYCGRNEKGEIDSLIIDDITGDIFTYGLLTEADTTRRMYTVDIAGKSNSFTGGFISVKDADPVKLEYIGGASAAMGAPENMTPLLSVKDKITKVEQTSITTSGGVEYLLSDSVVVYTRKEFTNNYTMKSLSHLVENADSYKISAYYDKKQEKGGRIRIIVAVEK